ncbi:MAG: glutathione-disulfide reductase [Gammaproteobacteria bacterium]|nr:glutathione-disulfide reductase [Gammaproteobacteria bacterium]
MFDFDLFVIGAGSGGVRAARMAAQKGKRVAIAEKRFLGGTCVNVGCVPKKLFYYGAHFAADFKDSAGFGWQLGAPAFHWPTLRDNKTAEIERLNGIYATLLDDAGVQLINGHASIKGAHNIELAGKTYSAERILVATGAAPLIPEFPGSELAISSDDVFYLDELPQKALVVGGGYIALEFAGILHGLGVDVALSYRGTQLLRHFDSSLGSKLLDEMQRQGITVSMQSNVTSLQRNSAGAIEVSFADTNKKAFDAVLYATGRKPCTNELGLESTKVRRRTNGEIIVDEYFQTDEPSIFALGDIIGTPELTPVAIAQAMAFVDNCFAGQQRVVDYSALATAVFCHPNIGSVGLSEDEAVDAGKDIEVFEAEFRHLKHTLSGRDERTYMKLVVDRSNDKVLGAHMMGQDAGEIVQGLAIALKAGATKAVFDATIGIHPTAAEEFVTMRNARG